MLEKLDIKTDERTDFIDVTHLVRDAVRRSGIKEGMCYLFVPHTTAAVFVNENADPDVMIDIAAGLERAVPFQSGYRHAEGNSAAHIKSVIVGHTENIFISNGDLVLGTWQGIFFAEFDGPRSRKMYVNIVSS